MKWLVGLAIAGAPGVLRADERAVIAEVAPAAPFDAVQLAAALRLRMPASGAPVRVRVVATPGGVRIEARGASREVALHGSTGPAAARLVALAASDLMLEDLAVAPAEDVVATVTAPGAQSAEAQSVTIGALGGVAAWQHTIAEIGIDVAIARGSWLITGEAGGGALIGGPLQLTAGVIRLGGGTRLGPFELRAGATLMPLSVGNGRGDATVLAGAGGSARLRAPLAAKLRVVVAGGFDVFATRTTYVLDEMPVLVTPRSALWLGAGVEVTP